MAFQWNLPQARQAFGIPGTTMTTAPISAGYVPQQQQVGSALNAQNLAKTMITPEQMAALNPPAPIAPRGGVGAANYSQYGPFAGFMKLRDIKRGTYQGPPVSLRGIFDPGLRRGGSQ